MIHTEKVRKDEKLKKAVEKLRSSYKEIEIKRQNSSIILIVDPPKRKYKIRK
tara:strand:- start:3735 stop:3890 length:156 start_codon:yes stop_codon:yes gene_type:complete